MLLTNKTNEYNLVIFSGHEQLDMLNVCLKSILTRFKQTPHIYIITDISLSLETCEKAIYWYPINGITIISGVDCLAYHEQKGNHLLKKFALRNTMGLKMAAVLQIHELKKPVLYSDTDIIWYQDPLDTLNGFLENPRFNLALSEDFQPGYDKKLVEICNLITLKSKPYFCAGIMFINVLEEKHYKIIESLLSVAVSQSNYFTEQTIFAYLNKQCGNYSLDKRKFIIELDDIKDFLPKKKSQIVARHYVGGARHLLWRDAIFVA